MLKIVGFVCIGLPSPLLVVAATALGVTHVALVSLGVALVSLGVALLKSLPALVYPKSLSQ